MLSSGILCADLEVKGPGFESRDNGEKIFLFTFRLLKPNHSKGSTQFSKIKLSYKYIKLFKELNLAEENS